MNRRDQLEELAGLVAALEREDYPEWRKTAEDVVSFQLKMLERETERSREVPSGRLD